ncbi:DUF2946 family protein [Pseudomonas sp. URMO17WK12:I4]|uniref:DUF2946 family protein n=1 Tax=Pseudomonas sp. URMO17WK12:I4 TaxID=1283292 RepID=UPI000685AF1C|nr:DUF2946 family protein [Pseudomonas sp. URMO17WK12:I4]
MSAGRIGIEQIGKPASALLSRRKPTHNRPIPLAMDLPVMAYRPLRLLLLCMLMLALPVQGIAALGMQTAMVAQTGGHGHGSHAMSDCVDACSHPDQAHGGKLAGHFNCSLCAFCVGVLALPPAVVAPAALPLDQPLATAFPRFTGHVADTPERPPRQLVG